MTQEINFEDFRVTAPSPIDPNEDIVELLINRRRSIDLRLWQQGLVLLGYMGWPGVDKNQQRHEWLRAHQVLEQWGREASGVPPGIVTMLAVTKEVRNPRLRHLYQEFENAYYGGLRSASRVLQTLVDLQSSPDLVGARYGASLRLAYALSAERTSRPSGKEGSNDPTLSNKSFESAWRAFGSVAPFGAAARVLENQSNERLRARGKGVYAVDVYDAVFTAPDAVLKLAKAYQAFLSGFISHGRSAPILPANSWMVSDSLGVREADLPRWTLNDLDRTFLKRRKRKGP